MTDYTEELYHIVQVTRSVGEDIADHCHLSDKQLLTLCGGIPDSTLTRLELTISVDDSCVYDVEVNTEMYYVSRNINFKEGTIINSTMLVPAIYRRNRIGTGLFYNQIVASRDHDIRSFRINAIQGLDLHGYVTWGKMGYSMRPFEQQRFNELCAKHNLRTECLYDLLKNSEGYSFWGEHGFSWSGDFSLSENSQNIHYFKEYLRERSLKPLPF